MRVFIRGNTFRKNGSTSTRLGGGIGGILKDAIRYGNHADVVGNPQWSATVYSSLPSSVAKLSTEHDIRVKLKQKMGSFVPGGIELGLGLV